MRWLVLLGLFLVALTACMSRYYVPTNRFELTNETGQIIEQLQVKVNGRTFSFKDLQPGATVSGHFATPEDEASFDVQGKMNDGTEINDFCGYVVWEESFQFYRIAVRPDGTVSCRY